MNFRWTLILAVILAFRSSVSAQDPPGGNGAWVLDLVTSGGFNGMGIGQVSVNSSGMLACASSHHKCPARLTDAALKSLADKVKAASAVRWDFVAVGGLCSDCVAVRLELRMRQPDGSIKTFIASWDIASFGVPEQLSAIIKALAGFD